jgi:hypothetical protein
MGARSPLPQYGALIHRVRTRSLLRVQDTNYVEISRSSRPGTGFYIYYKVIFPFFQKYVRVYIDKELRWRYRGTDRYFEVRKVKIKIKTV